MSRLTHSGTKEAKNDVTIKEILAKLTEYEDTGLTPEQVQQLKERDTAKKPITYSGTNRADCPICGATVRGIGKPFGEFCGKCGQRLDFGGLDEI
mgnify:CR=1 FL=1